MDLAEGRAKRHIPMIMEDWAQRLDKFLEADDRDILAEQRKDYRPNGENLLEIVLLPHEQADIIIFRSDNNAVSKI